MVHLVKVLKTKDQLTQYLCGEHHTGTEYLGVVIQSEAVHGVAIYQVDHARILLVQNGHGGLAGTLV